MISKIRKLLRLIHINYILAKHGLDNIIVSIRLFTPLRFLVLLNPWNWFRRHKFNRGKSIRLALEELGPIYVKFGQALSTRRDLLPADIADELAKLQDKVPPFCGKLAQQLIEKEFACRIEDILVNFDQQPLASASIAQVHTAKLYNGKDVVVKILRPKIKQHIERDLDLLYLLAKMAERYLPEGYRLRATEVVREFDHTIHDELDLMREAANASQLRRNFQNSPLMYVPEVYWSHTREKVMVMERIYGIPISDTQQLRAQGVNIKKLAESGVEIFFTQVFRDCFFHADMHPGNIFVSAQNPDNPKYLGVDFGIMGSLTEQDKRYLASNFLAFFNRDYRMVAQLHIESGWVPKDTRVDEFEGAIRAVCEPIFERPLKEISCAQVMMRLFQTGRRFNMEVQPQLLMLQKTLFAIEGLGRQLYPDLDLWNTAKPYLEKWIRDQVSPKALVGKFKRLKPFWFDELTDIPMLLHDVLKQTRENQIRVEIKEKYDTRREIQLYESSRIKCFTYGLAAAFSSAAIFSALSEKNLAELTWQTLPTTSVVLGAIGIISFTLAWVKR